eukprot:4513821-Prymnesium_polylepis.1
MTRRLGRRTWRRRRARRRRARRRWMRRVRRVRRARRARRRRMARRRRRRATTTRSEAVACQTHRTPRGSCVLVWHLLAARAALADGGKRSVASETRVAAA